MGSKAPTFPSTQWNGCSAVPAGPRWGQSSRAGRRGCKSPPQAGPLHSPPTLSPQPALGGFSHIKMFGLMGLTRLHGGTKKGPLFPQLLRCVLTYFWEAVAEDGGLRGGLWRLYQWQETAALGVCEGNVQSLIWGGCRDLPSGQAPGTALIPRNTFRSWLHDLRPVLPFQASVSSYVR